VTNSDLAARARELAGHAPAGSATRKAALCAAVALADTTTPAAARRVLDGWHDGPAGVRTAAVQLVGHLTRQEA
jgi:hypothetical protein